MHETFASVFKPDVAVVGADLVEKPQQAKYEDAEGDQLDDDTSFQQLTACFRLVFYLTVQGEMLTSSPTLALFLEATNPAPAP